MSSINFPTGEKSSFSVNIPDQIEYGNPIEHFSKIYSEIVFFNLLQVMKAEGHDVSSDAAKRGVMKVTMEKRDEFMNMLLSTQVPEELFNVLESTSKKEQIRILKGIKLTGLLLNAFFCKAYIKYNFLYSKYFAQHLPSDLDVNQMPRFAVKKNDGELVSFGKTTWTKGQIKSAIEQRNVIVSDFLDKDGKWHCFFTTYNSLKGAEKTSHLHFISHTFGMSRAQVLTQLKSKKYKLSSLPHIDFILHENSSSG